MRYLIKINSKLFDDYFQKISTINLNYLVLFVAVNQFNLELRYKNYQVFLGLTKELNIEHKNYPNFRRGIDTEDVA